MKLKFKVALPKEKNHLRLLKEVLSKRGFGKLALGTLFQWISPVAGRFVPVHVISNRI